MVNICRFGASTKAPRPHRKQRRIPTAPTQPRHASFWWDSSCSFCVFPSEKIISWWFQPPLKNTSQNDNFPQIGVQIPKIFDWNHYPDHIHHETTSLRPANTMTMKMIFEEYLLTSKKYWQPTNPTRGEKISSFQQNNRIPSMYGIFTPAWMVVFFSGK